MKKFVIFGLFYLLIINSFAKKDTEAWKSEKTLESQFTFFKNNVNLWDGYYMTKEPQLNEFHKSIMDTISNLEKTIVSTNTEIATAKKEITSLTSKLSETQAKLDASLSKENELVSLGMPFNKNSLPPILYSIIIIVVLIAAFAFLLFFRSNAVTKETEKRFLELTNEAKRQKESASDRETKLRRELQTERNKNHSS